MGTYTVRYQLGTDEHTDQLEAENAAAAARMIEERHLNEDERFELLEVQYLEDDHPPEEPGATHEPV